MDNNLNLLGMAKKAGRLEVGEEPVGAAARAKKAKLILLASDSAENTVRRAARFGELGKNIAVLTTPYTKAELGMTVGRTSCAMMALTDPGFAASFASKLAAQDEGQYAAAAEALEGKAEKALERQREQRRHEKNLERGKKRPWAAPDKSAQSKKKSAEGGDKAKRPSKS